MCSTNKSTIKVSCFILCHNFSLFHFKNQAQLSMPLWSVFFYKFFSVFWPFRFFMCKGNKDHHWSWRTSWFTPAESAIAVFIIWRSVPAAKDYIPIRSNKSLYREPKFSHGSYNARSRVQRKFPLGSYKLNKYPKTNASYVFVVVVVDDDVVVVVIVCSSYSSSRSSR